MLSAMLTSLLLLHAASATSLLKKFDDVVKVVHQVEATDGHRLMIKIDGDAAQEPYAAIAAHHNEHGWAFSKQSVKDVAKNKLITFVHTAGGEVDEEQDYYYLNEDFYKLERTTVGSKFTHCPEDKAEPFHFAEGSKKYYLAAFKNGDKVSDPKLVGVLVMDSGSSWTSLKGKLFAMGPDRVEKKKIPSTLSVHNLEVFCRRRHGSAAGWKVRE